MGDYLRDSTVAFRTVGKDELKQINADLVEIATRANKDVTDPNKLVALTYILRYDGLGIIRKDFNEIERAFGLAKRVEQVLFRFGTPLGYLNQGKQIEVHLFSRSIDKCLLSVADDDETWVDTTFRQLSNRLDQYKNHNSIPYSALGELFIQFAGVSGGFFISLAAANVMTPQVTIRHSFFVIFLGLLLAFSNLWTYVLMLIGNIRARFWPIVSFKQKPLGLIGQTVIGFCLAGVLSVLFEHSWIILKQLGTIAVAP